MKMHPLSIALLAVFMIFLYLQNKFKLKGYFEGNLSYLPLLALFFIFEKSWYLFQISIVNFLFKDNFYQQLTFYRKVIAIIKKESI